MGDSGRALEGVVTASEIKYLFGVSQSTIEYHVNAGHLRWRYTRCNIRLFELQSCVEVWGSIRNGVAFAVFEKLEDFKKNRWTAT